ncbi:MAG: hypothetical protein B7Z42_15230, partial [Brevundimonas sp. 12-68-7]
MDTRPFIDRARRLALPIALIVGLASCGGSGGGGGGGNGGGGGGTPPTPPPAASISDAGAAKLLTQATFGPTDAEIDAVKTQGYAAWINAQIALPSSSHQTYVENRLAQIRLTNPTANLSPNQFYESFWLYSATGQAQLRERMKLALSEIFVISLTDANIDVRGAASYYDMLGANAFGNYRTLLWDAWDGDGPAILREILSSATYAFINERDIALILKSRFESREGAFEAAFAAFPRLEVIAATTRQATFFGVLAPTGLI